MIQVVKCPSCAAPLEVDSDDFERCDFCGSRIVVSPNNTISPNSFGFEGLLTQAHKLKEILHLARKGRKIEAIKIYRETFGSGLAEAKDAVENLIGGNPINFTGFQMFSGNTPQNFGGNQSQAGEIAEIQAELRRGNKINAIKIYRETFNVGLKEAKEAVERLAVGESVHFHNNPLQISNQAVAKTVKVIGWATIISVLAGIIAVLIGVGGAIFAIINVTKDTKLAVPTPITSNKNSNVSDNQTKAGESAFAAEALRFGGEGIGAGYFKDNRLIAVDGDGRVYSAEYNGGQIQQFDANGKFLTQWKITENKSLRDLAADKKNRVYVLSSNALEIYDGSTQQLINRVERPNYASLAFDANGKLYALSYNSEFAKLDENGKLLSKSEPLTRQLNFETRSLEKLAIDGLGNFYTYDAHNKYILKYSPNAKFLIRFDNLPDKNKKISSIYDLAVDGKGRIFAAEVNEIHIFNNDGRYIDSFDTRQSLGIAFDGKNALWTASRPFVVKYELSQ